MLVWGRVGHDYFTMIHGKHLFGMGMNYNYDSRGMVPITGIQCLSSFLGTKITTTRLSTSGSRVGRDKMARHSARLVEAGVKDS